MANVCYDCHGRYGEGTTEEYPRISSQPVYYLEKVLSIIGGCANKNKLEVIPKKGKSVVVLNGGFGGCTAAKYIKLNDPSIKVAFSKKNNHFISCLTQTL